MQNQNTSYDNKESAKTALKVLIEEWVNAKPSRSPTSFARKAGLSETCVRRILNGDSLPMAENILRAVATATGEEKINGDVLSSLPKDLSEYLRQNLSFLSFEQSHSIVPLGNIESFLNDSISRFLFVRSGIGEGISIDEINHSFGELGIKHLDRLVQNGILCQKNGQVTTSTKKDYAFSVGFTKELLSESILSFFKDKSQTNIIFSVNESVSKEGYCEIMDVIEKANTEIIKICLSKPGNIPMTTGGFLDTMTAGDFFEKKEAKV